MVDEAGKLYAEAAGIDPRDAMEKLDVDAARKSSRESLLLGRDACGKALFKSENVDNGFSVAHPLAVAPTEAR
jgi:hypothetical protein